MVNVGFKECLCPSSVSASNSLSESFIFLSATSVPAVFVAIFKFCWQNGCNLMQQGCKSLGSAKLDGHVRDAILLARCAL